MKLCPKCHHLVMTTEHKYYSKGKLIRTEVVCNECHITIEVRHYAQKAEWEV